MRLLLTFTGHAAEVDGKFYSRSKALVNYKHLCRYRQGIDDILVVIRSRKFDAAEPDWPQIDGPGINVAPIPDPSGPINVLLAVPRMIYHAYRAIKSCDRYLLKSPEPTATIVGLLLLLLHKKYAVEVVSYSKEYLLLGKKNVPLITLYALLSEAIAKFLIKRAHSATYVSKFLRQRYPTRFSDREWVFCSAELTPETFGNPQPVEHYQKTPFKIIAVGRMTLEKGQVYLVRAFKHVLDHAARPVELHILGGGPEDFNLRAEAQSLGITNMIHFHGFIDKGPPFWAFLDQAHLFVMPSLAEAMGRALIEAMARGLPCIGSAVGGIPEYLPEDALFEPGNSESIAAKILQFLDCPGKLASMSKHNYEATQAFRPEALDAVKREFWCKVIADCK